MTHRIRITRIEDDGGVRLIEAKRERSNTYNSNAQGAAAPNPGFPGTSLRGPTDAVVMNMPVLRDEDDKPGIYWAPVACCPAGRARCCKCSAAAIG